MAIYYCNQCSKNNGMLHFVDPNLNFTASFASKRKPNYLLGKFKRHTIWPQKSSNEVISVFYGSDYDSYKGNIINSSASGSIEVDKWHNVNVIWVAPASIGYAVKDNSIIEHHNAVKLVLHTNVYKIHPFSTGSLGFLNKTCFQCGSSVF